MSKCTPFLTLGECFIPDTPVYAVPKWPRPQGAYCEGRLVSRVFPGTTRVPASGKFNPHLCIHWLGLPAALQPEALQDLQPSKGGLPAEDVLLFGGPVFTADLDSGPRESGRGRHNDISSGRDPP